MKAWPKSDPMVQCTIEDSGEHIVAGNYITFSLYKTFTTACCKVMVQNIVVKVMIIVAWGALCEEGVNN